ncbi:universal stress protein [Acaryochloris marina]|uniref:universal stress protein n=1 Tax=Acaryochloris marina TaxID=155978 RepID=UPI001BAEB14F|nr:universal stress protein [Acaryochloris marina]QUY46043.1 universal stress protein [Acaryochloris marina S15]
MIKKILVAMDHSINAIQSFEVAMEIAEYCHARLMLLHVLSIEGEGYQAHPVFPGTYLYPAFSDIPLNRFQQEWKKYKEKELHRLVILAEQAKLVGITTEITQKFGNPRQEICDFAKEWNADLILMGSRGHSGVKELVLGSISNYVVHHALCSVMVVRTPNQLAVQPSTNSSAEQLRSMIST